MPARSLASTRRKALARSGSTLDLPYDANLEREADELLSEFETYEEDELQRKGFGRLVDSDEVESNSLGSDPYPIFLEIVWESNLTDDEREVFLLRTAGYSYPEIGRVRGHSKQYAKSVFDEAVIKAKLHASRIIANMVN